MTAKGEVILRTGDVGLVDARVSKLLGTSRDVDLLGINFNLSESSSNEVLDVVDTGSLSGAEHEALCNLADRVRLLASTSTSHSIRWGLVRRTLHLLGLEDRVAGTGSFASVSQRERDLGDMVMRHSINLARYPGIDDLAVAVGISQGRASRLLADYFKKYHGSFDGWRSYLATIRVELAWGLLETRAVTARRLAEWLGYRSSSAMYHALERRGLRIADLRRWRGRRDTN